MSAQEEAQKLTARLSDAQISAIVSAMCKASTTWRPLQATLTMHAVERAIRDVGFVIVPASSVATGSVEDHRDAMRYRCLRDAPVDGTSGRAVIAVPDGPTMGKYVNAEDADRATDAALAGAGA